MNGFQKIKFMIAVLLIPVALQIGCGGSSVEDDDLLGLLLISQLGKGATPEVQARNAGYGVPDVPVRGVNSFVIPTANISASSRSLATSRSLTGTTQNGVVQFTASLENLPSGQIQIEIWVNGRRTIVSSGTATSVSGSAVLDNGANFLCIVILANGQDWGRSQVVRVNSNVQPALRRIELSWNGLGDLDLHLDDGQGGRRVYYGNTIYNQSGFNIELDVDNTEGYGPENIRIFSKPSGTQTFRCFVNYFSGSTNQTATVRMFNNQNQC